MIAFPGNPTSQELRGFIRVWFPLLVLVAGGMLGWRFGYPVAATVVIIGAVVELAALASPRLARAVFVTILTATYPLGVVTSTVALGLLFYLVFTPLGWAMRVAGRDRLRLSARGRHGYWQRHHHDDDPQRAFRQF